MSNKSLLSLIKCKYTHFKDLLKWRNIALHVGTVSVDLVFSCNELMTFMTRLCTQSPWQLRTDLSTPPRGTAEHKLIQISWSSKTS